MELIVIVNPKSQTIYNECCEVLRFLLQLHHAVSVPHIHDALTGVRLDSGHLEEWELCGVWLPQTVLTLSGHTPVLRVEENVLGHISSS